MKDWEKNVRKVTPYVPGEQPKQADVIKLNTNENPYPPSPCVAQAARELDVEKLRLYPDPAADALVTAIADFYHVKKTQVFAGVGSDDVLAMCFLTFFHGEKPILFPDITYSFYDVWAEVFRIPYERQPLDENFAIAKEDYWKPNGGIIFPNPNAPTGIGQTLAEIEEILAHNRDVVVIVDEAYVDFGCVSALELIDKYDNLLVVQTTSKSRSLAGLRIGYAFGSEELIRCLNDVKYSFNSYTMNAPALALGAAAFEDRAYFEQIVARIVATRERMKQELAALGFTFGDSRANFLFVTHREAAAKDLFEALKRENIYVRYFNKPRIDNYLRITIGTDAEMDTLIAFLKQYLAEKQAG